MPLIGARVGGLADVKGAFQSVKLIPPWPNTSAPRDGKGYYGPVPAGFMLYPGLILFEDATVINGSLMILCRNNTFYLRKTLYMIG